MRSIAYIPARAGSKGIPKKNIRLMCGKPLIAYTIEAAIASGRFERVFVSTDSEEIAGIARGFGAWVPFLRDPEFATDTATTVSAMCSDKARLEAMGESFDAICLLQITSPQRTAADICGAMDEFERTGEGVVSVSPVNEHPMLMRTVSPDGRLAKVVPVQGAVRRQDMPKYYKLNGAIYVNAWRDVAPGMYPSDNPRAYVMAAMEDIDTLDDWERVERRMREGGGNA